MKRIALTLLLLAAVTYGVATLMEGRHPAWGYVASFGEAAMIGAIADWFAVTALFRHPLGVPVPHTAIIPRQKARIGRELANFICSNFLETRTVLAWVQRVQPASQLAQWLRQPEHARALSGHLVAIARHALQALADDGVRDRLRALLLHRLDQLDLAPVAGRLLELLTVEGRHQAVLDGALHQLALVLEDDGVQARLADGIASELRYLSLVGLDNVAGRLAARKMVAGVGRLIGEMGDNPEHPIRLRFDEVMAGYIQRLQDDPELAAKTRLAKAELLAQPALAERLNGLWDELLGWLRADLGGSTSTVGERLVAMTMGAGERLAADDGLRRWIDVQILDAAPALIERYRGDVARYIVERVDDWNAHELTDQLERHIGRDLQFVRINGTLVGGLIGLLIHAVTQAARLF